MIPCRFLPSLFLLGTLVAAVGCPRGDSVKKDVKVKEKEAESNAVKLASELASQATDISHYRDALRLLEGTLNKPENLEKFRLSQDALKTR